MIPSEIVKYVMDHQLPFTRHWHPRAVSAQMLAAAVHVSGYRVAKSVICEADGKRCIALLPAAELLDEGALAQALGAKEVKLVGEGEFDRMFPNCEIGAEPPFGGLYGLPIVADEKLTEDETILFRAGSHEETMEMLWDDFVKLERPLVAAIGRPFAAHVAPAMREQPPAPMQP